MVLIFFIAIVCYVPLINSFIPKADFGEGIPNLDLFRVFSFFLFLIFVIHAVIKKDIRLTNKWISALGLFYLIAIVSISWSAYSYNSQILQEVFNTIFIPLFFTIISINLFEKQNISHIYIKHLVFAAFIMSLISVYQMVTGFSIGMTDFRASGTFGNPNAQAIVLVMIIPCVLYSVERHLISEVFGKIVSISVIIGIVCTVSRKGIITMFLTYLLYNFLKKKYKEIIVISIGFFLLCVIASGHSVLTKRFEKEDFMYHINEKWEMVQAGVRMFRTSPIIGLGYQGYYENFSRYFINAHKEKYSAHNIFIETLANYGLIGFIPFLLIFLYPLAISAKVIKQNSEMDVPNHKVDMAIICLSTVIPFMINGWFAGGLFYQPAPMAIFFANISLLIAIKQENHEY